MRRTALRAIGLVKRNPVCRGPERSMTGRRRFLCIGGIVIFPLPLTLAAVSRRRVESDGCPRFRAPTSSSSGSARPGLEKLGWVDGNIVLLEPHLAEGGRRLPARGGSRRPTPT
jgi:hypothetical protein